MGGGQKVSMCRFLAAQKIASSWRKKKRKKRSVLGHPVARVIASCQAHSDYGPPKMPLKCWQCKIPIFANTDFDCEESTHRK